MNFYFSKVYESKSERISETGVWTNLLDFHSQAH